MGDISSLGDDAPEYQPSTATQQVPVPPSSSDQYAIPSYASPSDVLKPRDQAALLPTAAPAMGFWRSLLAKHSGQLGLQQQQQQFAADLKQRQQEVSAKESENDLQKAITLSTFAQSAKERAMQYDNSTAQNQSALDRAHSHTTSAMESFERWKAAGSDQASLARMRTQIDTYQSEEAALRKSVDTSMTGANSAYDFAHQMELLAAPLLAKRGSQQQAGGQDGASQQLPSSPRGVLGGKQKPAQESYEQPSYSSPKATATTGTDPGAFAKGFLADTPGLKDKVEIGDNGELLVDTDEDKKEVDQAIAKWAMVQADGDQMTALEYQARIQVRSKESELVRAAQTADEAAPAVAKKAMETGVPVGLKTDGRNVSFEGAGGGQPIYDEKTHKQIGVTESTTQQALSGQPPAKAAAAIDEWARVARGNKAIGKGANESLLIPLHAYVQELVANGAVVKNASGRLVANIFSQDGFDVAHVSYALDSLRAAIGPNAATPSIDMPTTTEAVDQMFETAPGLGTKVADVEKLRSYLLGSGSLEKNGRLKANESAAIAARIESILHGWIPSTKPGVSREKQNPIQREITNSSRTHIFMSTNDGKSEWAHLLSILQPADEQRVGKLIMAQ